MVHLFNQAVHVVDKLVHLISLRKVHIHSLGVCLGIELLLDIHCICLSVNGLECVILTLANLFLDHLFELYDPRCPQNGRNVLIRR